MMKTKKLMMVALVSSTLALSGCGAMSTAIKKRNLEVKTQMSETIWLEPASERKRRLSTVWQILKFLRE